jgi:hypothetical protein
MCRFIQWNSISFELSRLRDRRRGVNVNAFAASLLSASFQVNASTTVLSGSIKSSVGEAMGRVMVSAKPKGGIVTAERN